MKLREVVRGKREAHREPAAAGGAVESIASRVPRKVGRPAIGSPPDARGAAAIQYDAGLSWCNAPTVPTDLEERHESYVNAAALERRRAGIRCLRGEGRGCPAPAGGLSGSDAGDGDNCGRRNGAADGDHERRQRERADRARGDVDDE